MVHHLQYLRIVTFCRRGGAALHPANVSTHAFPADISSGGAIQFLRDHVCFHDHTVLRQVACK